MASFKHGKIVFIKEIVSDSASFVGESVRVLGKYVNIFCINVTTHSSTHSPTRLKQVDVNNNTALIEYKDAQLLVDTSFLGDSWQFKINSLFQLIGEIEQREVCCSFATLCTQYCTQAVTSLQQAINSTSTILLKTI